MTLHCILNSFFVCLLPTRRVGTSPVSLTAVFPPAENSVRVSTNMCGLTAERKVLQARGAEVHSGVGTVKMRELGHFQASVFSYGEWDDSHDNLNQPGP